MISNIVLKSDSVHSRIILLVPIAWIIDRHPDGWLTMNVPRTLDFNLPEAICDPVNPVMPFAIYLCFS